MFSPGGTSRLMMLVSGYLSRINSPRVVALFSHVSEHVGDERKSAACMPQVLLNLLRMRIKQLAQD